jgi:ribosomal protein S18 acetylase RimI-like enzyme
LITIVPVTRDNLETFKKVRLEALRESPRAFGSTYEREVAFTEEEWLKRLERWNGERGIGFLAMDGEVGCGMAGALVEEEDGSRATLVSMWTAPEHRKSGVGKMLVNAVLEWAETRGVKIVDLLVTGINHKAIGFYERLGFVKTGRTQAYPIDPTIMEFEMARRVG